MAQSVSSARGISRSANLLIADYRPRASGYRPMADVIPRGRERALLTQGGPRAARLSGLKASW